MAEEHLGTTLWVTKLWVSIDGLMMVGCVCWETKPGASSGPNSSRLLSLSDLGNRLTELNKSVVRLHTEMKHLRQSVANNGVASNPMDGASVLRKYIMKVRNSFQNYEPEAGGDGQGSPVEVVVHQDVPLVMEGALPLLREEKQGEAEGQAEGEAGGQAEGETGVEVEEEVVDMTGAEEEEEAEPVIPQYEPQEETEDRAGQAPES